MIAPFEYDEVSNKSRVFGLRERGVQVWSDARVFVAADVPLDAIESGATLMNAVIRGPETRIGAGSQIGTSGTAMMENVQAGQDVELGAGTYSECVLLDRVKIRGFAELRAGTVLEEEAELGHNVGLKNTIFTAAVVAGSCINFCDIFVTGGRARDDHTEIGSGSVHFNFAPTRNKFASLIGDVTGVLMRSEPVFIGGNSGIVAPASLVFGTLVPAGTIVRQHLVDAATRSQFGDRQRIFAAKLSLALNFIANLTAYAAWYTGVRLSAASPRESVLYRGVLRLVRINLDRRHNELMNFLNRVINRKDRDPILIECAAKALQLTQPWDPAVSISNVPESFAHSYQNLRQKLTHSQAIKALSSADAALAADWLGSIVQNVLGVMRDSIEARSLENFS
jgi:UDP-N-acetylglucosamine/UDP-N-acetylgalactosamine diphosphorylase